MPRIRSDSLDGFRSIISWEILRNAREISPLSFEDSQADSAVARIGSIDLLAFRNFPSDQDSFAQALGRMIGVIIRSRGDWNGHVITLRRSDWEGLATFLGSTLHQVGIAIENRGLEFKIARNATK